jgi:copper(I)-binding protein
MKSLARCVGAAGALIALAIALPAHAVDLRFNSTWMRPAVAGTDARAYVDIVSDTPLRLTGASTPVAKRIELVQVARSDGTDAGKVVRSMPVSATAPTRLAYKGSHLRLVGVRQDLVNGQAVPVTLQFADGKGRRHTAQIELSVRGLVAPEPPPAPRR